MKRPRRARIVFVGTGNAFSTGGRDAACLWIEPRGQPPFLVDCGPTALAGLERAGLDPGRLTAAYFTHLHGDHTAGWPFLLLHAAFVARRTNALRVVGPQGTRARLELLATSCYEDLVTNGKLAFPLRHTELPVRRSSGRRSHEGVSLDTVPLVHHPTSLGYRFHLPGLVVGVSGDTAWCPELVTLARGCDLLVLECTCLKKPDYPHVSLEELRAGRSKLEVPRIVLVHTSDDVARAHARRPIPGVRVAKDGMILAV